MLSACSAGNSGETKATSGDIRTSFNLKDDAGNVHSLENVQDQYLFVNFWATWCKPCIAELPSIVALRDSLRDEPISFFLVTNETPDQTNNFLKKRNIDIPGYHMAESVEAFGLAGFPTTLIINPEGEVVLKVEGADEWNDPENVAMIRKIVQEDAEG